MIQHGRQNRGFTLIELLCSMVIGSLILLVAASVLASSGDGYERVGGSVAAEREARAVMTQFASDLSSAVFHKDGVIEKSTEPWPGDNVGFLSLQPAQAQTDAGRIGDLCAVSYYIKDLTISGKTVRCLMRGFRESAESFAALGNDSVSTLFASRPNIDEPVAFGVVSFEARPKSLDGSGQWVDWIENDETGPDALETRIILARRSLVGKLKQSGDWDGTGLLGPPSDAALNKDLEIYGTMIRYGNRKDP